MLETDAECTWYARNDVKDGSERMCYKPSVNAQYDNGLLFTM